jgi:phosphoribosylformylglycinamidine (FGAM) synthase-like amidotransferase family enzyme
MKMREIVIALVVLAAGIAMNAAPARAQGTAVDTSSPIVVKQKAVKPVWLKAEVIHADQLSIMVRDEANSMNVHTFTYSDKARERMQAVLEAGGFQYGDKIKIRYLPGKTEALEIRGEPSKPI